MTGEVTINGHPLTLTGETYTYKIGGHADGRGTVHSSIYRGDTIDTEKLCADLIGQTVPGLGKVRGVERFASWIQVNGSPLGLLIESVDAEQQQAAEAP